VSTNLAVNKKLHSILHNKTIKPTNVLLASFTLPEKRHLLFTCHENNQSKGNKNKLFFFVKPFS
jgi:hypothetical protein